MIGFQELTRKQIYILSAALSAVLLTAMVATFRSCLPHTYPAELVAADSLCDSNADSAAVVLSRLERSGGYDGADRMYLDLLKVKLTNNLYEPQKDSTIFRVVDYFEDMGDRERLCQAYYYQGKYYKEHNDAPQTLKSFQQALEHADSCTSVFFRSKIYSQMGTLFTNQDSFEDALAMYRESYRCDSLIKDTASMVASMRDIAQTYRHLGKLDSSELMLKKAYSLALKTGDDDLGKTVILALVASYITDNKMDKAYDLYARNLSGVPERVESPAYAAAVRIYSAKSMPDSVYEYSRKLLTVGTLSGKVTALEHLVDYYSVRGDLSNVRLFLKRYKAVSDSVCMINAMQTVAKMHSLYNYNLREKENAELKLQSQTQRFAYVSVVFVLLAVCLVLICFRERRRRAYSDMKHLYEHLEQLYAEASERAMAKDEQISELIERIDGFTRSAADGAAEKVRIFELLRDKVKSGDNMSDGIWAEVSSLLDKICPSFKSTFIGKYCFDERDYRICMLVKLGFLNAEIATIMCRTPGAISQKRATMYKKVFGKIGTPKDFDEYVRSL